MVNKKVDAVQDLINYFINLLLLKVVASSFCFPLPFPLRQSELVLACSLFSKQNASLIFQKLLKGKKPQVTENAYLSILIPDICKLGITCCTWKITGFFFLLALRPGLSDLEKRSISQINKPQSITVNLLSFKTIAFSFFVQSRF